jgi:magnesium and cobalt transporter
VSREEESVGWLLRIKHLLQLEPANHEQLIDLLRDVKARALISAETLAMLESVIQFSQMKVRDIMLPKSQMICIQQEAPLAEVLETVSQHGHSRYPVIEKNKNEILGILHAKDLLRYTITQKRSFDIHELIRQATIIPESKRLDMLLSDFRHNRNHMAIVVDEYGAVAGFVTLEDIIEQIIGDIADEFDIDEEVYIKSHGAMHYIIKAHTPIEALNEQLQTHFSDLEYDTIGGLVTGSMGHLPKRGETTAINGFEFKVISADARCIKLLECFDLRARSQG